MEDGVPPIKIVALRNGDEEPLPWERLQGVSVVTCLPNQLPASVSHEQSDRLRCLVVDCTAVDFPVSDIESTDWSQSYLFVCRPGDPDLVLRSIGPHGRVWWYNPFVFEPAIIESKRLLTDGQVGEFRGGEILVESRERNRPVDASGNMLPFFFRGSPDGIRASTKPPGAIYWYDNLAIFVGIASTSAPSGSISGTFACSGGSIVFKTGDNRVTLYPAGGAQRHMPLPEGDGTYYFMRELFRSIACESESPISTALVREAFTMAEQIGG